MFADKLRFFLNVIISNWNKICQKNYSQDGSLLCKVVLKSLWMKSDPKVWPFNSPLWKQKGIWLEPTYAKTSGETLPNSCPVAIPETISGRISAPVPLSFLLDLKWRMNSTFLWLVLFTMLSAQEKCMLVNFWVARCTLKYFSGFMCKLWNRVFCEAQSIALFGCGQLVRTERERGTSRREHWERSWGFAL